MHKKNEPEETNKRVVIFGKVVDLSYLDNAGLEKIILDRMPSSTQTMLDTENETSYSDYSDYTDHSRYSDSHNRHYRCP